MKDVSFKWSRQKRSVWDGYTLVSSHRNMKIIVYPKGQVFDDTGRTSLTPIRGWGWLINYGDRWRVITGINRKRRRDRNRPNTVRSATTYKSANKAKRDAIIYASAIIKAGNSIGRVPSF